MSVRVEVNFDLCESFGVCVAAAPEVFDLDEDDLLHVLTDHPGVDQLAAVRDAAARCPKRAIVLISSEEKVEASAAQ